MSKYKELVHKVCSRPQVTDFSAFDAPKMMRRTLETDPEDLEMADFRALMEEFPEGAVYYYGEHDIVYIAA